MKFLPIIFAFYLLGMLMAPCNDANNDCAVEVKTTISSHAHQNDINDNCSPLCNCNCCHTIVDPKFQSPKVETVKTVFEEKKYPIVNQFFITNYYGNIWQPPKINV